MPGPVTVEFDAWFDREGGAWIAESATPRYGICADAPTREALAAKLEGMVLDVAEALHGTAPAGATLSIRWDVRYADADRPAAD